MYLNADIFSFLQLQRLLKNIMSHQAHYRNKETVIILLPRKLPNNIFCFLKVYQT